MIPDTAVLTVSGVLIGDPDNCPQPVEACGTCEGFTKCRTASLLKSRLSKMDMRTIEEEVKANSVGSILYDDRYSRES